MNNLRTFVVGTREASCNGGCTPEFLELIYIPDQSGDGRDSMHKFHGLISTQMPRGYTMKAESHYMDESKMHAVTWELI